jgi:molybdopterin-containing oxidoreductase family membrane subunit
MSKIMLTTGLLVAYGYLMEGFTAWYGGDKYETFMFHNRMTGPYAWSFWSLMFCNVLTPQILWWRKMRVTPVPLFFISLIVNVGMWLERFVIVVTSLHRDFVTSSWGIYAPTVWDWMTYIGTMGLFATLMFLFIRSLPAIAISEIQELVHHKGAHK